jgi:hypothetical protein
MLQEHEELVHITIETQRCHDQEWSRATG